MAVDLKSSGAEALPQIPGSVDVDATAAGTEAERLGTAIENTQVAKNKDAVPEEWTGAAADAASTEIQALGVKVKTLSEAFPTAGKALKDWDYQLRGIRGKISLLQHSWDTYLSEYNAAVADAGQQEVNDPTIDKESLITKARSTLRTHQETLRGKYDGHISMRRLKILRIPLTKPAGTLFLMRLVPGGGVVLVPRFLVQILPF